MNGLICIYGALWPSDTLEGFFFSAVTHLKKQEKKDLNALSTPS